MSIDLSIQEIAERDIAVLKCSGFLEFNDRAAFLKGLEQLQNNCRPRLVIDLSAITGMSSLFIGSLIDFGGKAAAAGKAASVLLPARVAEACRSVGLDKVLTIVEVGKAQG